MDVRMRSFQARRRWVLGGAVGLGALIAPLLVGTAAWARPPLVVDDDGQQCGKASYETIAAALEVAVDGDVIRVCPGVYDEPLHVTKSVRIVGPMDAVNQLDCLTVDPAGVAEFADTPGWPCFSRRHPPAPTRASRWSRWMQTAPSSRVWSSRATATRCPRWMEGMNFSSPPSVPQTSTRATEFITTCSENVLAVELGSSGDQRTRVDHNCLRENWWAMSNQIMRLENAVIDVNTVFRTRFIGVEVGWGYRPAEGVTVRENTIRETGFYGLTVENSTAVGPSATESYASRGQWHLDRARQ